MFPALPLDEEKFSEALAATAERLEIARLEYGKFCTSRNGPIEDMAGHRQLGHSAGFPEKLKQFCDPTIIGISSGVGEATTLDDCGYGTVLRPAALPSGEVWPVFCRVQTRPEDGEGGSGRRYTLARYLVAPNARVHPATLLKAMDSLLSDQRKKRLPGLTRHDEVTPLLTTNLRPEVDDKTEAFLRRAVLYVLSGVPVCVTERVTEEEFFKWVSALWHTLPHKLRPYLSAGWNVESSLAGRLIVTAASQRAANCAVFSPSVKERTVKNKYGWTDPSVFVTWKQDQGLKKKQEIRKPFTESGSRLRAGYMYAHHVFSTPVDEMPAIDELLLIDSSETEDKMKELTTPWPPSLRLKGLPDFLTSETVQAFRYPGVRAYDEYRFKHMKRWLDDNGAGTKPKYFTHNAQDFFYKDYKQKALLSAVESLGDPDKWGAGDAAVWASFAGNPPPDFGVTVAEATGDGSDRARLLAALQTTDHAAVLSALVTAAGRKPRGEGGGFADEIVRALHNHLSATLHIQGSLRKHEEFLLDERATPEYLEWVCRNAFDVLMALSEELGHIRGGAAQRVRELAPSPEVEMFCRWAEEQEPTRADVMAVDRLSDERLGRFLGLMLREWNGERANMGERRDFLLKWLRMESPAWRLRLFSTETFRRSPLLSLAFRRTLSPQEVERLEGFARRLGWSPRLVREAAEVAQWHLDQEQMREVVGDVEREAVPPSLKYELALLLLRRWPSIGPFVRGSNLSMWVSIFAWWHPDTTLALLPNITTAEWQEAVTEEMLREDENLTLGAGELDALMADWRHVSRPPKQKARMAKRYWAWAARSSPHRRVRNTVAGGTKSVSSAVDLCRDLTLRRLETNAPPESDGDFETAEALALESGQLGELRRVSPQLWAEATQPWHLRLLLTLSPERSFEPSPLQLGKLVYYRQWLSRHLERYSPQGNRRKKFGVAAKEFHELTFPGGDGIQWQDAYATESVVWAAFKGVPAGFRVNLTKALRAYDPTGLRHMSMCREYLMGYDNTTRAYSDALIRVLHGVLLPALRRDYDRKEVKKLFKLIHDEAIDESSRLSLRESPRVRMADSAMQALITEIVVTNESYIVSELIKDFYEQKRG